MSQDRSFLPYGRQCIEQDDIDAVTKVLQGDYLTTGPAVAGFEADLAARTQARFAVAVTNGTAALHLAALALGLGPGDWAVVPSLTFLATANAVRLAGAEVIFADVDPQTGLMEPGHLQAALDANPDKIIKAAFAVHLNGQCCDMAALAQVAAPRGIRLVEDACHALGALAPDGNPAGGCAHSAMAIFSFHPVKTVAMGEGGAVTTNDPALAQCLMDLRTHGMVRDPARLSLDCEALDPQGHPHPWYYEMQQVGLNYRASDINCALGRSQLAKLDRFIARRARLVDLYRTHLPAFARPVPVGPTGRPAWHLMVVHLDFAALGHSRDQVMRALAAQAIGSQVHYLPVHRQAYYRDRYGLAALPGADGYYRTCLSLPLFVGMDDDDPARVARALKDICA